MKRRPQGLDNNALAKGRSLIPPPQDIGLVLSGGGVRAAYQAGALRALNQVLREDTKSVSVIIGSSIGAVNGLLLAACMKVGFSTAVDTLEDLWRERTYQNTFRGSATRSFVRAIRIAIEQYINPGPNNSGSSVFDPTPLRMRLDEVITQHGGLSPENRAPGLSAVGVMTTIEGPQRKPLAFVSAHHPISEELMAGAAYDVCYVKELSAKHGFASAALPSILPCVELDTQHGCVKLVDGGISQNVPVDPAVRLGARRIIVIDISGRSWWYERYSEPMDKRPEWEIEAGHETFCLRPPKTLTIRRHKALGPILKQAVGQSSRRFMAAAGPIWPLFRLVKNKMGEDAAYEVLSYVALDQEYAVGLIESGFNDTIALLRERGNECFTTEDAEELGLAAPTAQLVSA